MKSSGEPDFPGDIICAVGAVVEKFAQKISARPARDLRPAYRAVGNARRTPSIA